MTVPHIRVAALLKAKPVLIFPAVVGSALVGLMTLIYFGSIVDPAAGVTTWYDRHGLDRMSPEVMEYVHTSAQAYRADV